MVFTNASTVLLPVPSLREDSLISFRADQVTPAPSTSNRKFIAACAPDYGQEKMVDEGVCKER